MLRLPLLLLMPGLLLFLAFFLVPLGVLFVNSFYDYSRLTGIVPTFTLKNYARIFGDPLVLDLNGDFAKQANTSMVGLEKVETKAEIAELRAIIERHVDYTKSARGQQVLASFDTYLPKFVKVLPKDYKRMLACIEKAEAQGLTGDEAVMAAFEENARDLSRVGGN